MVTTLTTESIEQFRASLSAKGHSSFTVKSYCTDMTGFLQWTRSSSVHVDDLEAKASQYLNETRASVAPKTTLRRLSSLRAFAKLMGNQTFLVEYRGPKPAKAVPHPLPEGIAGIRRMISYAATAETKAMMALLGLQGLRITEARSILPEHVNLDKMELTVRGKGDKTRVIPLSQEAWTHMQDAFFKAIKNKTPLVAINDSTARAHVQRIAKRAGITGKVTSHDGRATFATQAADNGMGIRVIQELLGHSSITSTEVYVGVTMDKMREAVVF